MMTDPILEVENLEKFFSTGGTLSQFLPGRSSEPIKAVDDVSFDLHPNESKGVIGESGCGKTTLLMTLMGLYDPTGGEIRLDGKPLSGFDKGDWKDFRRNVQIVFQDPFNSLDPKMSVRNTLKEPLKIHDIGDHDQRVHEALETVELGPPEQYLDRVPSQLSGGELQRVSIARALILEPKVILADEPVSMLDVSTQASILRLLSRLIDETGVGMVYISHDLSTVSYVCDDINVMYLGRFVEQCETKALIDDPKHPYSQALMEAIPFPDPHLERKRTDMEGAPRDPVGLGDGCRFRDRCPDRMDICEVTPETVPIEDSDMERTAACHLYYDHEEYVGEDIQIESRSAIGGGD